jgi:hypothetical protein
MIFEETLPSAELTRRQSYYRLLAARARATRQWGARSLWLLKAWQLRKILQNRVNIL